VETGLKAAFTPGNMLPGNMFLVADNMLPGNMLPGVNGALDVNAQTEGISTLDAFL